MRDDRRLIIMIGEYWYAVQVSDTTMLSNELLLVKKEFDTDSQIILRV